MSKHRHYPGNGCGMLIIVVLGGIASIYESIRDRLGFNPIRCPVCSGQQEFAQATKREEAGAGYEENVKTCPNCDGDGFLSWWKQKFGDVKLVEDINLPLTKAVLIYRSSTEDFIDHNPTIFGNATGVFEHKNGNCVPLLYFVFPDGYTPPDTIVQPASNQFGMVARIF